jgi:DNA-binding MarR family transcriptional regulator
MSHQKTVARNWWPIPEQAFGPINVLVNNAGIYDPAGAEQTTIEQWDRVIAINQTGSFLGIKAVIPSMRRAGGGSIINVSSVRGIIGSQRGLAYHSSKGALHSAHPLSGYRAGSKVRCGFAPGRCDRMLDPVSLSMSRTGWPTPMPAKPRASQPIDEVADLMSIADELGTTVSHLYMLIRRPVLNGGVSLARARVLAQIVDDGPKRITELAYVDQVSQPSMTEMVTAMEAAGWVFRKPDPNDGRAALVDVAPVGRAVLLDQRRVRSEALADRLRPLPAKEVAELRRAVKTPGRLVGHLSSGS